jgi:4-hydroxy-3-methylbut-2-enyl diphosphate reductase
MCFGVRDALETARHIEQPATVTVFGQLVHNPVVNLELESRGFVLASEQSRALERIETPTVLITAHGISGRERLELAAMGKHLVDTTCPLVRRAHAAAMTLQRDGYFVVVIGKRSHVEVRGLTGDLERFDVVEGERDVRRYPLSAPARLGIIAQTTVPQREAEGLVARIRAANPDAEIRFINTICQPTRDRQAALEELLTYIDILVVVGGRQSNNTRRLVARAHEAGIRALHIEGAGELSAEMFHPAETAGLTAGTSTLAETIDAVRRRLESFHPACSTDARPIPMEPGAVSFEHANIGI